MTCPKTCHFTAYLMSQLSSISVFCVNTAREVVTVLLISAKYLAFYLHISTCTYSGTHTQTHMYNQHTRGMAKTGHRSLVERGERKAFVRDKGLAHMQKRKKRKKEGKKEIRMSEKNVIHESKEKVQDLPAKLPDYFLRSDKSNINQFAI